MAFLCPRVVCVYIYIYKNRGREEEEGGGGVPSPNPLLGTARLAVVPQNPRQKVTQPGTKPPLFLSDGSDLI
jgi:hypothetical protein